MRNTYLTLSILTAILLAACADAPQNDSEILSNPEQAASAPEPTPQKPATSKQNPLLRSRRFPLAIKDLIRKTSRERRLMNSLRYKRNEIVPLKKQ